MLVVGRGRHANSEKRSATRKSLNPYLPNARSDNTISYRGSCSGVTVGNEADPRIIERDTALALLPRVRR